jgi:hypothetical protein
MEVRMTEFIQEIFWFWYLNANFLLTYNQLFLEPLCHYQWPPQVQVLPVGSHYHNLIGCGSRSEEGPGFACEKTLLSVLDKRGCLKGSRDAGVLLLQAESTSVVCIVAASSSLDFEVFFLLLQIIGGIVFWLLICSCSAPNRGIAAMTYPHTHFLATGREWAAETHSSGTGCCPFITIIWNRLFWDLSQRTQGEHISLIKDFIFTWNCGNSNQPL